jgi:hypothetical protein
VSGCCACGAAPLRWRKATEEGDWVSPAGASVAGGAPNERGGQERASQVGRATSASKQRGRGSAASGCTDAVRRALPIIECDLF